MQWTRLASTGALALVGVIGAIDAAVSNQWDLFVLFVAVVLLTVPLAASVDRSRRPVRLRRDLAAWAELRAEATGEPAGAIVDRAVAAQRDRVEADGPAAAVGDG